MKKDFTFCYRSFKIKDNIFFFDAFSLYNKVENNKIGDNKRIRRNKDEKVWKRYFTIDECCYGNIVVYRVWEG